MICRGIWAILVLLLGGVLAVEAQDPEFSQFYANPLYLNPAFAGTSEPGRAVVNYRNQWPQKGATYSTYAVSFDSYSSKYHAGLGFQLLHDRQLNDLIRVSSAMFSYSYHIRLDNWSFISAGLQAGMAFKQFDPSRLIFPSMIDQLNGAIIGGLPENMNYADKFYPDFAVGVVSQVNDFFGGISVNHLNQPDESLLEGDQKGKIPLKVTAHLGARSHQMHRGLLSREFTVSPNVIYQQQGSFKQLNLGVYLIEKVLVVGGWYRNNLSVRPDALIFLAGMANQWFQLGYSFDYTLSQLSNYSHGSHEISLTFFLGKRVGFDSHRRLLIPPI